MSIIEILRITFSGFCSQDPFHSFSIGIDKLLLCVRCSGIYFGALAFFIYYLLTKSRSKHYLVNFIIAIFINFIFFLLMKFLNLPYNKFIVFLLGNYLGFFFGGTIIFNLYWDKKGNFNISKMLISTFISMSLFILIVFVFRWYLFINLIFIFILLIAVFIITI
ncbi:DUF2085 domain-containing protein, partial [bacterium]|nr:DUF2085 domain-containing protein [bacterium]